MTAFPVEIFERILYFCDGETLKRAKLVNSTWKNAVDFLTRVSNCCALWRFNFLMFTEDSNLEMVLL